MENEKVFEFLAGLNRDLDDSKRTYCEHCKKTGHTKDTYWTLHGKPADWKPKQPNKTHGHQASTKTQADKTSIENHQSAYSVGFSSDQFAKLYELLSNFKASGQSSISLSSGPLAYKDLSLGKTIVSAKEREGLYYFDEANVSGQCPPTACTSASSPRESELLL
ncbi:hypothetical protein CK203_107458 [Vitis vinifera]|uniref:Uncharacterized protein n=1 Tax=Vitis vinifera TaxID=29760 RepID=A0A438EHE2_VITVI|nr:hypothetical protein CK203_107458 [Vitis vinifera]